MSNKGKTPKNINVLDAFTDYVKNSSESRQERRKAKREWEKMWKKLDNLVAHDPAFHEKLMYIFQTELKFGVYNVAKGPTGIGKTHRIIRNFMYYMVIKMGCKVLGFVAPETVVTSPTNLEKHLKDLKRNLAKDNIILDVVSNPTNGQIVNKLNNIEDDEVVIFTMTDSTFNNRVELMVNELKKNGLEKKSFFCFDECHVSATSDVDYYEGNQGLQNYEATCVKFSSIERLLEVSYVLGLSATLVKEQLEETFGTKLYHYIDFNIIKEDLFLMVSGHRHTLWFDSDDDFEKTFMKFITQVLAHQEQIDALGKKYYLPDELIPKVSAMISLEPKHPKGKAIKDDKHMFIEFMDNTDMTIPKNFEFDLCLDTSSELEVWRFMDGKITRLNQVEKESNNYHDSDTCIKSMSDKSSSLRVMVMVGKGIVGMDVLPLSWVLCVRTPTNKYKGEPVVHRGVQLLGRARRLVIRIEDLVKSNCFTNPFELIDYYCLVNSFQAMLPNERYWQKTIETIEAELPSGVEIRTNLMNE